MTGGAGEVRFFVLPDLNNPLILARVRYPDVFEAISPSRADWQQDPGLFDLPYERPNAQVSVEQAAELAREWGATFVQDDVAPPTALIRRMPANWADPSRAEQRAWSVEFAGARRKRAAQSRDSEPLALEEIIDLTESTGDTILPAKGS